MSKSYDAIVVGVGGMGSVVLAALARRRLKVLGLEQFGVGHARGSSHGQTRIIRQAYFEHPDYVPLLRSAYRLWDELSDSVGRRLRVESGIVLSAPPDSETVTGAIAAAETHGVLLDVLTPADAASRFPAFRFPVDDRIVFEPGAGYLFVTSCVRSAVEAAERRGAVVRPFEPVREWSDQGNHARVATDAGEYVADRVIFTGGPWTDRLLPGFSGFLRVVRKVMTWHVAPADRYSARTGTPAYFFERHGRAFYGFPSLDGRTVKLAEHTGGEPVDDPSAVDRRLRPEDVAPIGEFIRAALPEVNPEPVRHSVCLYTLSPDHHFVIDRLPGSRTAVVACGFSGHGFKFASVVGEALADLAIDGRTEHPIGFLNAGRLART